MLVPTRVGMIPGYREKRSVTKSCPHTRGDDPDDDRRELVIDSLSPHAWG